VIGWVGLLRDWQAEAGEVVAEVIDCAVVEFATLAEEEDPVKEVKDLGGGLVDGRQDCAAGECKVFEDVDDDVCGVGVEATRGLIKEENRRCRNYLNPDADAPVSESQTWS
jgi:hypothetical protein